ncbi:MAG: hypothetical protein H6685_02100 [Deltaproteobacteria bacterium]|nr:hypothetical protein [Deltaproteobacteria bacterium]
MPLFNIDKDDAKKYSFYVILGIMGLLLITLFWTSRDCASGMKGKAETLKMLREELGADTPTPTPAESPDAADTP